MDKGETRKGLSGLEILSLMGLVLLTVVFIMVLMTDFHNVLLVSTIGFSWAFVVGVFFVLLGEGANRKIKISIRIFSVCFYSVVFLVTPLSLAESRFALASSILCFLGSGYGGAVALRFLVPNDCVLEWLWNMFTVSGSSSPGFRDFEMMKGVFSFPTFTDFESVKALS